MRKLILAIFLFCSMSMPLAMAATGGTPPPSNEAGIDCTPTQLANGQCSFSIYKVLGIKQDTNQDPTSVGLYIQDIVLSLTFFIGTVITVALIYSGILFIRSGVTGDSSEQETATKGIKLAFV